MSAPWSYQLTTDVIRDGMGLELIYSTGDVAAEVFRCDADKTVTVHVFRSGLPEDVIQELIEIARRRLGTFEDGTPLPEKFQFRSHVE